MRIVSVAFTIEPPILPLSSNYVQQATSEKKRNSTLSRRPRNISSAGGAKFPAIVLDPSGRPTAVLGRFATPPSPWCSLSYSCLLSNSYLFPIIPAVHLRLLRLCKPLCTAIYERKLTITVDLPFSRMARLLPLQFFLSPTIFPSPSVMDSPLKSLSPPLQEISYRTSSPLQKTPRSFQSGPPWVPKLIHSFQ